MDYSMKLNRQVELNQLLKKRDNLSVKIYDWKKKNKDTSDLQAELSNIRNLIQDLKKDKSTQQPINTIKETKKVEKKVIIAPTKKYTKKQLEKCQQELDKMLDNNDWVDGYQFRSSENMYIPKIYTQINKGEVEVCFTIQYKTKVHRVEKTITKRLNPDNYKRFQKYIDDVETWVMLNSGDMDDKDIVFGQRFNMVQFEKQGFESRGWIKYR